MSIKYKVIPRINPRDLNAAQKFYAIAVSDGLVDPLARTYINILIHFLHAKKTNQTRLPDGQEMRLAVGIFAKQNRSKTSRPVMRTTGLIPIAIL